MSSKALSTSEMIRLANEAQTLVAPSIVRAFNRASTPQQKKDMRLLLTEEKALRDEVKAHPKLKDAFTRMLCLNILERVDYGYGVLLRSRALEPHLAEVSERLRALDGARSLRNDQRANLVGFLGASHVAALMRQTGGPIK